MEPRTLILNAWMSPHSIVTWQQAVCLLVTGKLDVLEEYEAEVSSPSLTIRIPAVGRLRKEISLHKKGVKFSRINILTRDGFRCCYCGHKKSPRELNYDHVIPRCKGGKTVWENIVTSCYACNTRKGRRTPKEAGLRMHFQPHRPRVLPMTQPTLFLANAIPDPWKPYLMFEGDERGRAVG
jgi:5-methylcytosine-specific restriction endonuclease McrA